MLVHIHRLGRDNSAAIAPMVALSMFALIGAGGIAFDYARLASMDTELQNAADQAALAAASQLDRTDGARARATASITAASTSDRLAANYTRMANDDGGRLINFSDTSSGGGVTVHITYCSEFDDSVADTAAACTVAPDDGAARFAIVTTQARTANYALTPVVAAFSSGGITATAVAGIESTICNVAPLLVCVPNKADGTPDLSFPDSGDIGKGIILKPSPKTQNTWAPGNYGLLDFGNGTPAVMTALMGFGLNGCKEDDGDTEPGNKDTVTDALNTRFDVYAGTGATKNPSVCNSATGYACPAKDTRKDMTVEQVYEVTTSSDTVEPASPNCGQPIGALPGTLKEDTKFTRSSPPARHFTRDNCHIDGSCTGNFGDGVWDSTSYLSANHPGVTTATTGSTRYDIYKWELANDAMDSQQISKTVETKRQGSNYKWTITKQCAYSRPKFGSAGYPTQKDRRVLPIVAADCSDLRGKGSSGPGGYSGWHGYKLLQVFDVFLTEPSLNRAALTGVTPQTFDEEIYAEVIGPADSATGGGGFQYYAKSKPHLIR
nr:pilus assembly protein TadG-related protein [uncultured Sphingomonas sp.]